MVEQIDRETFALVPGPYEPVRLHPDDVLTDHSLSTEQKRAILASWVSDAHAVPGSPALRRLPSGASVTAADILAALKHLDVAPVAPRRRPLSSRYRRLTMGEAIRARRRSFDGDDGPPSAPARAARPAAPKAADEANLAPAA